MGEKLIIFLINGTEYGPRTVQIINWFDKTIYSHRYVKNITEITKNA